MPGWAIALIVCACLVPVTAFMAGLLLPALAKASQKAQMINCENNLKQIGVNFRVWAGDHNGQLPFNVSTNQGGTMELCSPGPDGFDRNSWLVFRAMSNELGNPRILVDPNDRTKQPADDFAHLQANNVSYLIHSGTNVDDNNPGTVLAYCPIHNNFLFADGSVQHLSAAQAQQMLSTLARQR
jgi:prepilin-type processing-associated H-X9-DG protein